MNWIKHITPGEPCYLSELESFALPPGGFVWGGVEYSVRESGSAFELVAGVAE